MLNIVILKLRQAFHLLMFSSIVMSLLKDLNL